MLPIFPTTQVAFGSESSVFGLENTASSATSRTITLGVGWWMVQTGAHNTAFYTPDSGTTKRTLIPVSAGGVVWSDGNNVGLVSDATGDSLTRYTQILGPI